MKIVVGRLDLDVRGRQFRAHFSCRFCYRIETPCAMAASLQTPELRQKNRDILYSVHCWLGAAAPRYPDGDLTVAATTAFGSRQSRPWQAALLQ